MRTSAVRRFFVISLVCGLGGCQSSPQGLRWDWWRGANNQTHQTSPLARSATPPPLPSASATPETKTSPFGNRPSITGGQLSQAPSENSSSLASLGSAGYGKSTTPSGTKTNSYPTTPYSTPEQVAAPSSDRYPSSSGPVAKTQPSHLSRSGSSKGYSNSGSPYDSATSGYQRDSYGVARTARPQTVPYSSPAYSPNKYDGTNPAVSSRPPIVPSDNLVAAQTTSPGYPSRVLPGSSLAGDANQRRQLAPSYRRKTPPSGYASERQQPNTASSRPAGLGYQAPQTPGQSSTPAYPSQNYNYGKHYGESAAPGTVPTTTTDKTVATSEAVSPFQGTATTSAIYPTKGNYAYGVSPAADKMATPPVIRSAALPAQNRVGRENSLSSWEYGSKSSTAAASAAATINNTAISAQPPAGFRPGGTSTYQPGSFLGANTKNISQQNPAPANPDTSYQRETRPAASAPSSSIPLPASPAGASANPYLGTHQRIGSASGLTHPMRSPVPQSSSPPDASTYPGMNMSNQ